MRIREDFLTIRPHTRSGDPLRIITGVVIHWVGTGGHTPEIVKAYFDELPAPGEPGGRNASAHYVVGIDGEIVRLIPENETAWHAGPSADTYPETEELLGGLPNWRTIGIELCHPTATGEFTPATLRAGAELAADILHRNGVTDRRYIIRHYDCTGKDCPRWMIRNPGDWEAFRSVVDAYRASAAAASDPDGGGGSPGGGVVDARAVANGAAVLAYKAPVTGVPATFAGPPSSVLRAGGSGVYIDGVVITIPPGVTNGTCVSTAVRTVPLPATARKAISGGKLPIREGDEVTVTGITGKTGSGGDCAFSATVFVAHAGQTSVKAG